MTSKPILHRVGLQVTEIITMHAQRMRFSYMQLHMNDIDISNQYKEAKYNGTSSIINRVKTGRLQSIQSNNLTGDRT